ncbi:Blp family class II bacteriocin [Streptococcus halichoeri]|uniref:Blp family class II bacteriocin n=1 Tax=Streptococcus halichoeri TaxID=254785 RepID=UPI001359F39D|nr:Blp family class II bacteriocin [Streptococcus halichoeri]
MNTLSLSQFERLDLESLAAIEGGKNNWQTNVNSAIVAGATGAGLGFPLCGVPCGYIGAKAAITLWAGVTGATGGF